MGPIQSLEDLFSLLWRRKRLIMPIILIGMILSVIIAKIQPPTYSATASLQVELPLVTTSGPAAIQPLNSMQMLSSIENRLTTRDNILALIERHQIFPPDSPVLPIMQVDAVRRSLRFQSITNQANQLTALLITASAARPDLAARIANDLAQSILDMGAEGSRATAEASFSLFKEQETRLWAQISALETEIANYREENRLSLPGANEASRTEIIAIEASLRAIEQEVSTLQAEQAQIQSLSLQRATDRRRLEDIAQRLTLLAAQATPLSTRKTALEASLKDTAEVDRVLAGYERQRRQLQEQYTVVSQRMAEAETAQNISSRQQTERFSLLDRALTPPYADSSNAKKIAVGGTLVSIAMALGLAFLLDMLNPVLRSTSRFEREVGIRPIVSIPETRLHKKRGVFARNSGTGQKTARS